MLISQRLDASIMLYLAVASNDILCLEFYPRQEAIVALLFNPGNTELRKWHNHLLHWGVLKPKLVDRRYMLHARYSSTTSQPPIGLATRTKVTSPESVSKHSNEGYVA
jgi:hypothetical protein